MSAEPGDALRKWAGLWREPAPADESVKDRRKRQAKERKQAVKRALNLMTLEDIFGKRGPKPARRCHSMRPTKPLRRRGGRVVQRPRHGKASPRRPAKRPEKVLCPDGVWRMAEWDNGADRYRMVDPNGVFRKRSEAG